MISIASKRTIKCLRGFYVIARALSVDLVKTTKFAFVIYTGFGAPVKRGDLVIIKRDFGNPGNELKAGIGLVTDYYLGFANILSFDGTFAQGIPAHVEPPLFERVNIEAKINDQKEE